MARAHVDSSRFSHVVVCPACGYREVFATALAARDARDRHDMLAHPAAARVAANALEHRARRSGRWP